LVNKIKPNLNIFDLYKDILTQFGDKTGWITQFFKTIPVDGETFGATK
jgi:hypothetical protein